MATMHSTSLQIELGNAASIKEGVRAVMYAVRLVRSDYCHVDELHLSELIFSIAIVTVSHDRYRHTRSERVPHEVALFMMIVRKS